MDLVIAPLGREAYVGTTEPRRKSARVIMEYDENQTASLSDPIAAQDVLPSDQGGPGRLLTRASTIQVSEERYPLYAHPLQRVALYDPATREHLERRVQIVLHQLIAVHATNLFFTQGRTTRQGGKGTPLEVLSPNGQRVVISREAAHSSVIPSLQVAQAEGGRALRFFAGSLLDDLSNTTVEVPQEINQADSRIDRRLRIETLALLNRVARAERDPILAVNDFVQLQLNEVVAQQRTLALGHPVRAVLQRHEVHLQEIQARLRNPEVFDQWLGIQVEASEPGRHLRPTFQRLQARMIQKIDRAESQLFQKIEAVRNRILEEVKRQRGGRTPNHFNLVFDQLLLSVIRNEADRSSVRRLLKCHYTVERKLRSRAMILQPTHRELRGWDTTEGLVRGHLRRLTSLATTLCGDLDRFRQEEVERKGRIIRLFREECGWTHQVVDDWFRTFYPALATISIEEIERGVHPIEGERLEAINSLFGVNLKDFTSSSFWTPLDPPQMVAREV